MDRETLPGRGARPGEDRRGLGIHRDESAAARPLREPRHRRNDRRIRGVVPGVDKQQVRAVLAHEATALRKALARRSCFFDQGTPAPLRARLLTHSVDALAVKGRSDKGKGSLAVLLSTNWRAVRLRSPRSSEQPEAAESLALDEDGDNLDGGERDGRRVGFRG